MDYFSVQNSNESNSFNKTPDGSLINSENVLEFNFNPSIKDIPSDLMKVKQFLYESALAETGKIVIETRSPLVLILIPLLLPIKEKAQVKFMLDENQAHHQHFSLSSVQQEISKNRNFKEILEAAHSLGSHGIDVIFTSKILGERNN
jgi:hypothetical protein